jgi:release factor glutamine methyltransferase
MTKASEVRLFGHRFGTDPEVFHPLLFSSSKILAASLLEVDLEGRRVLDMGTGTGLAAVVAAARGAKVTACDLNPRAVALARANAARNGVEVQVLESDLFAALEDRRFDLISFNVPFYAREPRSPLDFAYYAGENLETIHRFAAGCGRHLEPDGRVVIVFSEDCGSERIGFAFSEKGLSPTRSRVLRRLFEDFFVTWFRASSGPST